MPRELEPIVLTLTPRLAVGELTFEFDRAGHPVRMVAQIVRLTDQPDGTCQRQVVAPVVFDVSEFSQWPEFPSVYARISEKVWGRFDAEEDARTNSVVAGPAVGGDTPPGGSEVAPTDPTLWQRITGIFS